MHASCTVEGYKNEQFGNIEDGGRTAKGFPRLYLKAFPQVACGTGSAGLMSELLLGMVHACMQMVCSTMQVRVVQQC